MGRIACAFVPRFELAVRARADDGLWRRPAAVADLAGSSRVRTVTPAAEQLGIAPGQLVSHARGLCPDLELFAPDEPGLREAEREVLGALGKLSPWLDVDGAGAFFLGLEAMERLIQSEKRFGDAVRAALRERGFAAGVAVADAPFVAWVTARRTKGITCVPSGAEAKTLAQIPVSDLGLPEPALKLLSLLGVESAGTLAQLPAGSLGRRLGAEGARIERLCKGQVLNAWPTAAKVPSAPEEVSLDLEVPTEDLEPLLFLAKSLVDRLLAALARERVALLALEVQVRLDDRSEKTHLLTPAEPTLDGRAVMDLLRLWLESHPFPSAVARLRLVAKRTGAAQARQLALFRQREQEEYAALERAVARLASAFGTEAVVRPALADTYRPEARLRWEPFANGRAVDEVTGTVPSGPPPVMLKLLSPPEPVSWAQPWLRRPGKPPLHVVHAEGPHRVSGEWWEAPFDRSYFWLSCASGELCWVFRDEANGQPYLMAMAD